MNAKELDMNVYYTREFVSTGGFVCKFKTWHMLSGNLQFGGIYGNINKSFQ